MRRLWSRFFALCILIAGGYGLAQFMIQNEEIVQIRFFYWQTKEAGLGFLLFLTFTGGVFLSAFLFFAFIFQARMESSRVRRENQGLQAMMNERHSSSSKI